MVQEGAIGGSAHAAKGVVPATVASGVGRDDELRRTADAALKGYGDELIRVRDRTAPRWMHRVSAILIAIGAIALVMAFAFRLEAIGIGTLSGTEFLATLIAGTVLLCVGAFVGLYSIVLEAGVIAAIDDSVKEISIEAMRVAARSGEVGQPEVDRPADGSAAGS